MCRRSLLRAVTALAALLAACNLPQEAPAQAPLTPVDTKLRASSTAAPSAQPATAVPTPLPDELVWFGPNMGSKDYAELFTKPEQWERARSRIQVFKFHSQNVLPYPCSICGRNTLDTFVEAGAFEKLTQWGIPIAVEVGAVKEWGCNGTEEFRVTREVIRNVRNHGGEVTFLAMDEPYMGGELVANGRTCGLTMEQTADVAAKYMGFVTASYPDIIIGDTEPYPYFSVGEIERWIEALEARGKRPAFFHIDVNPGEGGVRHSNASIQADLRALRDFMEAHTIPFGVIFVSNTNWSPRSDRAYWDSTMAWLHVVKDAIGRPQQVVFSSWVGPAPGGAHEFPINLPDDDPSIYSHTRLLVEGLELLGP